MTNLAGLKVLERTILSQDACDAKPRFAAADEQQGCRKHCDADGTQCKGKKQEEMAFCDGYS